MKLVVEQFARFIFGRGRKLFECFERPLLAQSEAFPEIGPNIGRRGRVESFGYLFERFPKFGHRRLQFEILLFKQRSDLFGRVCTAR